MSIDRPSSANRIEITYKGCIYFRTLRGWHTKQGERRPDLDDVLDAELRTIANQSLWVGLSNDGATLVFDPQVQQQSEITVCLWMLEQDRFIDIERASSRGNLRKADPVLHNQAVTAYRASVVVRHRLRVEKIGLTYGGVRVSTRTVPRNTHCWKCQRQLTSEGYPECISCGWILCECGACGCRDK